MFVAAETREFDGILRHASLIKNLSWSIQFARSAELNQRPVVLLANGPGPNLAAAAAEEGVKRLENVEGFVSTGYCGALDSKLKRLSIFVASSVNGIRVRQPATEHDCISGALLSQDAVAWTVEEKSKLKETGAIAVEMEAAGVEAVARKNGMPFYCVRVVTDAASEALALDFNKVRDRNGRFSRARIIAAASRRPLRVVPELLKLDRVSKSASLVLGDFIATCRF